MCLKGVGEVNERVLGVVAGVTLAGPKLRSPGMGSSGIFSVRKQDMFPMENTCLWLRARTKRKRKENPRKNPRMT